MKISRYDPKPIQSHSFGSTNWQAILSSSTKKFKRFWESGEFIELRKKDAEADRELCNKHLKLSLPNGSSKNPVEKHFYQIKDCELPFLGTIFRFDSYIASDMMKDIFKLCEVNSEQDLKNEIGNFEASFLARTMIYRMEYKVVSSNDKNALQALALLYNVAKNGGKTVFLSAHGATIDKQWRLLSGEKNYLKASDVVHAISKIYSSNSLGGILLNSCNERNTHLEMRGIHVPVIACTDINSPDDCPTRVYLPRI